MRTSSVSSIVDRLYPLLHIDPITYLPPEITYEIFSYLDPQTLVRASSLSRIWRTRALDARLWRGLFGGEGWSANLNEVKSFEEEQRAPAIYKGKGKARARSSEDIMDAESKSPKRRVRENRAFGDNSADVSMGSFDSALDSARRWADQHGVVEADEDETMEDVQAISKMERPPRITTEGASSSSTKDVAMKGPGLQSPLLSPITTVSPTVKPLLIYSPGSSEPRLNWQYLYRQKRRLEENWIAGKYTNFQLPHPNHPYEAHSECVYTIQYTRKHLVSGSRDHTLRIWNLDTQRLTVPPLQGHDASVLCLQFDDRPTHDIVVSGGSDCNVIIWRFSTGKMVRKLRAAHSESVLNLRFDDRFLVTCSKDKTIKIWNRAALMPKDDAYPHPGQSTSARFPTYILNIDNIAENQQNIKPLEEYSLLMTLYGHTAAVNAIQIFENQIVSASGDRHVKVWDVKNGVCLKTIPGHQKGIACVQFDGRRIVSGSSDETVRIFDRSTAAEVACLRGHANLVRTVQARFGDSPWSAEDDEAEAKALDRKYFSAKLSGKIPMKDRPLNKEERRARNAGGKESRDAFALGAKLPPGGGGSRWARIVSGSYDETVIIWKRNPDGKWVPAHQLYQWQAVINAGGQLRLAPQQQRPGQVQPGQPAAGVQPNAHPHVNPHQQHAQVIQAQATALMHQAQAQLAQAHASMGFAHHIVTQHQSTSVQTTGAAATGSAAGITAAVGAAVAGSATASATGQALPSTQLTHQAIQAHLHAQHPHPPAQVPPVPPIPQHVLQQQHPAVLPHHATQQPNAAGPQPHPQIHAQAAPVPANQPQQNTNAPGNPNHAHHHQHGGQNGNMQMAPGTNSRVFKLQFDSRRIICCSQDPTIVGWDFANGDQEIIRASQFFGDD